MRSIIAGFLLMATALTASPTFAHPPDLFTPVDTGELPGHHATADVNLWPDVLRSRLVHARTHLLRAGTAHSGDVVRFNLFDDSIFDAVLERSVVHSPENVSWFGRLDGVPGGYFSLAVAGDILIANVNHPEQGLFRIRTAGEGLHVIQQLDPGSILPCLPMEDEVPDLSANRLAQSLSPDNSAAVDDGSIIDVMVLYTPEARDYLGGETAIRAEIQLAIDEMNDAFASSLITPRMRLVHAQEVDYEAVGYGATDLSAMRSPTDGQMDDIHFIRTAVGADLVCLVSRFSNAAGTAYVRYTLDPDFEALAFSIVNPHYLAGSHVFSHELGHNLGCSHDHDNSNQAIFPYAFGHRFTGESSTLWRTIMSYYPGTGIPHFSNPDVLWDNTPTGIPEGEPLAADCARTIDETALVSANHRPEMTTHLYVSDATVTEASGETRGAVFTVYVLPAASEEVRVDYATENGSALAGVDFTPTLGSLVFASGETAIQVSVEVFDDATVEPDESLTIRLSGAVGAPISGEVGVATIVDNDAVPEALLDHLLGIRQFAPSEVEVFDVNGDGECDAGDLVTMLGPPDTGEYIVDDLDDGFSLLFGPWVLSSYLVGWPDGAGTYYYARSQHTTTAPPGLCEWRPTLLKSGDYEVFVWYVAGTNRTVEAPFTVNHADGTDTVAVNQQVNGSQWFSVGTYRFEEGSAGNVTLSNDFLIGSVCHADAVRFVRIGK